MFIDIGQVFPALRTLTFDMSHNNVIEIKCRRHGGRVGVGNIPHDDLIALLHYLHQFLSLFCVHIDDIWNSKIGIKKMDI